MVGFEEVVAALRELIDEVKKRLSPVPKKWDSYKATGFVKTDLTELFTFEKDVSWFRIYNAGTVTVWLNFDRKGQTEKLEPLKTLQTKDFPGNPKTIYAKCDSATACDIYISWWY